jgi:import inner membrane translocase subunit TIM21
VRVVRRTIYSEAFEKVQQDPTVSYLLGSPLRAYGMDHGGHRGRRNEMERWELTEPDGSEVSVVRFTVAGPQGMGIVQTQVPRTRRRGDFLYIIFEHRPSRKLTFVLDNRGEKSAAAPPAPPAPLETPPPPPTPLAPAAPAAAAA